MIRFYYLWLSKVTSRAVGHHISILTDCDLAKPQVENELSLQWRHNELDGVSNHRRLGCLLNRLFGCRSKKTSKFRVAGLCEGNPPVTAGFPSQWASNAENISIWWRHHGQATCVSDAVEQRTVGRQVMGDRYYYLLCVYRSKGWRQLSTVTIVNEAFIQPSESVIYL